MSSFKASNKNPRTITQKGKEALRIYDLLYSHYGSQRWWPAKTRFEVIAGAILTQNTAWKNVEKAIRGLKEACILTPLEMKKISVSALSAIIRPAGYHNVKARRLKNFVDFLFKNYAGSLDRAGRQDPGRLRKELLTINGIGPETCDSILLYAFSLPFFVVDAYTKRIFSRHGFFKEQASYDDVQKFFTENLPEDLKLYNEYHALIVKLCKEHCRSKPACRSCPLEKNIFTLIS